MENKLFGSVYRALCEYDAAIKSDDLIRNHLLVVMNRLVDLGMLSIFRFDIFPTEIRIDYSDTVPWSHRITIFRKDLIKENAVIHDVHAS